MKTSITKNREKYKFISDGMLLLLPAYMADDKGTSTIYFVETSAFSLETQALPIVSSSQKHTGDESKRRKQARKSQKMPASLQLAHILV